MAKKPKKDKSDKKAGFLGLGKKTKAEAEKDRLARRAKNEADKKRREAEKAAEKKKKEAEKRKKDAERAAEKRRKEAEKEAERKRKEAEKKDKKNPSTPPPTTGGKSDGSLAAIFGSKFNPKDKSVLADQISVTPAAKAPLAISKIPGSLTPLHNRPSMAAHDWRASDRMIRSNAQIAKAQDAIANLRADVPLMLLPLRLETRFTDSSPHALRLRVFPDQIALDGLERRLTEAEVEAGKEFLKEYKNASDEKKPGLWAAFCASGDPWRSAWIVRCLKSDDFGMRKASEPDRPALAPLLPDCWLVTGRAGGETFHAVGKQIPTDLRFSPDLSPDITPSGDLAIDPEVDWMVDFDAAVRKGMALQIPLPDKAQDQIDDLVVVGIKTQGAAKAHKALPPAQGSKLFEQLLEAHNYDWGGGFVPAGTATNNTSSVRSDWAFNKPDVEALRVRELGTSEEGLTMPEIADDGDRALRPIDGLASNEVAGTMLDQAKRAFGLGDHTVLSRYEHRQGTERAAARAMNTLLWPVTLGEMFSQLLSGPDTNAIDPAVPDYLKSWFCDDLTGGNALPAIRSSATTYGVLPIESFTRRRPIHQSSADGRKREELTKRLHALLPEWQAAVPSVLRLAERPLKIEGFESPEERYLGILKQDSSPAGYAVNGVWNLRGLPGLLYQAGELKVHPKHNHVDVQKAFEDSRKVTFSVNAKTHFVPKLSFVGKINLAFQADKLLENLWTAAGFTHYREWPDTFRDGSHQEQVLREKIALIDATLNVNSGIYEHRVQVPLQALGKVECIIHKALLFEALAGQVETHLRAILGTLNAMLKFVEDHKLDNSQFVQAFDPPSDVYKGVVGEEDIDPRLSWLTFYEPSSWPKDQLVEVDAEAETVSVAAYLNDLADYAESHRAGTPVPGHTQFPDGNIPLLYSLLRTAIKNVAVAPDPASNAIGAELDRQEMTLSGTATVRLDPQRIGELSEQIKMVGVARPKASAKKKAPGELPDVSAALSRTLASRHPAELQRLAKQLRSDAKAPIGKSKFPAKEAKILATELDRVAKLPPQQLKTKQPSNLASKRTRELGAMKEALLELAKLNPDQLELLMQQTLGLASWRLDAWLTSLTTKRLFELRDDESKTRNGLQIGAFGWVEDLRRDPRGSKEAHEMRSQGFIHTPSLAHAKAAAVLRSGWNAYGDEKESSPLAVDLSSERMRFAQWAFASISRGQDPGDLLGREFERTLRHVYDAPQWIHPLRQAVLALAGEEADPNLPVVDGLELLRQWRAIPYRLQPLATKNLMGLGGDSKLEFARVINALGVLEERVDALADAGLAEAMFALVQGNVDRAGAQLSAISDGIRGASDLQMLSTAPSTMSQTHRVVMLAPKNGGWIGPKTAGCPLAAADPTSEAIAAHWIGTPENLQFRYEVSDANGERNAQGTLSWADLLTAKSPFGGGALTALKSLSDSGWSQESELALRLRCYLVARDPSLLVDAILDITPTEETAQRLDLMAAWREVLFGARTLHPRDCGADISEGTAQLDLGGLEGRAANTEQAWRTAAQRLLSYLPEPVEGDQQPVGTATIEQVNEAIRGLVSAGCSAALPLCSAPSRDVEGVYAAAWSLAPKLRETRAGLRALPALADLVPANDSEGDMKDSQGSDQEARARRARASLKLLLGANLAFAADFFPADRAGVSKALKAAPKRGHDKPIALNGWLEKMAYVREPLRRLNDAVLLSECSAQATAPADFAVAQWPNGADASWIALSPPPERGGPSISWLIAGPIEAVAADQPISGLVIDEIIDKLPSPTVNTGVALHFDAPNCEAPQSILLALPPEGEKWSHEVLLDTLSDCFAMARMRPVDSDAMPDFNAILPAIFADETLKPGVSDG